MSQPVEGHADLTPLQRQYLRLVRGYFRTQPTYLQLWGLSWRGLVIRLVFFGVRAWLLFERDRFELAWLMIGVFLGGVLRDSAYFRQSIKLWPATLAIIDRQKLDDLIGDPYSESDW